MKIIVLSDTHIPDKGDDLPTVVMKECMEADMIIHAGDFTSLEFYNKLKKIKPLKAVLGNMDCCPLRDILKDKETFEIQKYKIGLMHGFGAPNNILDNVQKSFNENFDLIIFGHSHAAISKKRGKTLFFNPGSCTDKIFTDYNSFGIIEINKSIKAHIVKL
ncbi:MAG: metallophosphoesterase [Candidatus Omnitrophota bacterium]